MKKLLVAITAVALGTFAWGDGYTGQSFNGMTAGPFTTEMEDGYWEGAPDKTTVSGVEYTYSREAEAKFGGKPAEFAETSAGNNLAVHTALNAPLYRSVVSGGAAQTMAGGFYFDSLVHFTACDAEAEVPSDAKLAVWLQDMTEAEPAQAVTNLMITAGYFSDGDSTIEKKTYNCGDFAEFGLADGDDWCRLTIKAIADLGDGSQRSGFVVFVNGMAATHTDSIGVTGSVVDSLNDQAKQWNAGKQLFPSLVAQDATIAQVGFAGQGGVDDISFTRTAPSFAADFEFIKLTFDSKEIAKLFVTDGTTTKEFTASPAQYVITSDADKYYYYQAQDGYISVPADKKIAIGDSKTVDIDDVAAALFAVGTDKFATWTEAVTAAKTAGAPIMLAGDVTEGIELNDAGANITLDLAGKNITVDEGDAITVTLGTLFITNSTETVGAVTAGEGGYAVVDGEDATGTSISAGIFNGIVGIAGDITGGKFSYAENKNEDDECTLTAPEGFEFVKDDEEAPQYWVLQEVQVTEAEVTIIAGTGVKVTVVDGDGTTITTGTKVEVGTVLTITATPNTDYELKTLTVNGADFTSGNTYTVQDADVEGGVAIAATAEAIPYVAQIGDGTKYLTFAAAFAAAQSGDTIKLLDNVTEGALAIAVSKFTGAGLTIDLNKHTYTFNKGKDGMTIQTNDVVTIKNGTLAVAAGTTPFRDFIRVYGNADTVVNFTDVTFDCANMSATWLDGDANVPTDAVRIEGGVVTFDGDTAITSGAGYAVKVGNHANKTQYAIGKVEFNTTGDIVGKVILMGGTFVETAVGEGSNIEYHYGCNVWTTWQDGVTSTEFEARIGTMPELDGLDDQTRENNDAGILYKTLEAAIAAAKVGDTVSVCKALTDKTVSFPVAVTFGVGCDVTLTSLTLNGSKIALAGAAKITVPAALGIENDFAAAPTGMKVELVKDSTYTYQLVKAADPKLPEDPIVVPAAEAEAKVAEMNANKADYLKAPAEVEFGDGEFAEYAKLFTAVSTVGGETASIAFMLNADGEKAVADAEAAEKSPILAAIAAAEGDSAELKIETPIKGFYYGLKQAGELKLMKVDQVKLGGAEDVEFSLDKSGAAGFYEIVVSPTKIEVENKGE